MSQENKRAKVQGGMAEHLDRYRNYIDGLKSGKASGISAAFGRASDLLPPEALSIPAPKLECSERRLGHTLFPNEEDRQMLRESLELLIKSGAISDEELLTVPIDEAQDFAGDAVGLTVETETGLQQVLSTYLESGQRMFMLSDLSIIDEETFRKSLVHDGEPPSAEAKEAEASANNDTELPAPILESRALTVLSESGMLLWQVEYDEHGVRLVSMGDGSVIKRAEGRNDFVFSLLCREDGDIKFYILSGLVVDPGTGNIYMEANQGAYSSAFLNNGWTAHHYRSAQGAESFFLTEPMQVLTEEGRSPETFPVNRLRLDMETGSLFYSMTGERELELSSRRLID
ncbi:MAG: hypothetical protein JNN26_19045 [Candidatus Obscuribacter sp.]|nr:hypothetical protein [Candidatus Obscuribacter sp.]